MNETLKWIGIFILVGLFILCITTLAMHNGQKIQQEILEAQQYNRIQTFCCQEFNALYDNNTNVCYKNDVFFKVKLIDQQCHVQNDYYDK